MENMKVTVIPGEYVEEPSKELLGRNTEQTFQDELENITALITQSDTELDKKAAEGNCALIRGSRRFLGLGLIMFLIFLVPLILLGIGAESESLPEELNTTTFDWRITNYQQHKLNEKTIFSKPFYTKGQGHKYRCMVEIDTRSFFVVIELMKSEHDAISPAVFFHKITVMIMDQRKRTEKWNIIQPEDPRFNSREERRRAFYFSTLAGLDNWDGVYVVDDAIHIRVILETQEKLFSKFQSKNGTLLWNIPNFSRTKVETRQLFQHYYSEYFYSAPVRGYRMQAELQFQSATIDLNFYFLKGPYDDILPSVFPHKVTFIILDQKNSNGNHLTKTSTLDPKEIGEEMASVRMKLVHCHWVDWLYSEVKPYLVNDSILIKIIVEPLTA